jgi:hypothetical protein
MHTLDINPGHPKPMSGDTYAAYGLIGYYHEPGLRLRMTGDFPHARFMSFESYESKKKHHVDVLFDHEISADEGSQNPFQEGVPMNIPLRSYSVEVVPENERSSATNILRVGANQKVHSIFYRAYVPQDGIEINVEDLPKIHAFDAKTGAPRNCPIAIDTVYKPGFITNILRLVPHKTKLEFKEGQFPNGTNAAIPSYHYVFTKQPHDDVAIIKFKTPYFIDTQSGEGQFSHAGDVRYWSLCTQNVEKSQTLVCLPDYLSTPDENGLVTVVVGRGEDVEAEALKRGFNFIEDRREPSQKLMGIFYRNLLVKPGFPAYTGEYLPRGVACKRSDFLEGRCNTK